VTLPKPAPPSYPPYPGYYGCYPYCGYANGTPVR